MEGYGNFRIIYSEETIEFLNRVEEKAKAKIMYNINKCKYVIDTETETLVIATHGFVKKSKKTPAKEIAKAKEIRRIYYKNKLQK